LSGRSDTRKHAGAGSSKNGSPHNALAQPGGRIEVDAIAIRIVFRTASRLSIYKPAAGGVLAWEVCGASK
jgi:hypothetical protein